MDKAIVWSNKAVRILYSPESSFPSTVGQEYSGSKSRHSSEVDATFLTKIRARLSGKPVSR